MQLFSSLCPNYVCTYKCNDEGDNDSSNHHDNDDGDDDDDDDGVKLHEVTSVCNVQNSGQVPCSISHPTRVKGDWVKESEKGTAIDCNKLQCISFKLDELCEELKGGKRSLYFCIALCIVCQRRFLNSIYEQSIVVLLPKPYMKMKLMYTIEKLSSISSSSSSNNSSNSSISYCTTAVTEDVSIVTYNSNGGWQQWHHPHHPHHPSVFLIVLFHSFICYLAWPGTFTKYFEHCQQALLESSGVIVRYYVFYVRLPYDKSDMVVATTLAAV
uniref:Uncharacterized protein n=1 Tax=Glossina austeni TaxID=7395 RepID=A0A1A9UXT8_GLOAU